MKLIWQQPSIALDINNKRNVMHFFPLLKATIYCIYFAILIVHDCKYGILLVM